MLTFEILGVGLILANEYTHFEGDQNKLCRSSFNSKFSLFCNSVIKY